MSATENRNINLFINGKFVGLGSLKDARTAYVKLRREFAATNKELEPKKYAELAKQVNIAKKAMDEHSATMRGHSRSLNMVKQVMVGVIGANLAERFLQSVIGAVPKAIQMNAELSDSWADVMKTTNLLEEEVEQLYNKLGDIDTRTARAELMKIAEVGGRFGIGIDELAVGDVDGAIDQLAGFTEAVDKANVALGDEFAGGTEEIATNLSLLQGLFSETRELDPGVALDRIGSILNELGANFKATSPIISDFMTNVGSMSPGMKPAIQDAAALGVIMQENGISAEKAGRSWGILVNQAVNQLPKFAKQMGISQEEAEKLINTDATSFIVQFTESLKGMNATESGKVLKELGLSADGVKKVVGALTADTGRLAAAQEVANEQFSNATSLQDEFNIKNENAAARVEKAYKKIRAAVMPYIKTIGEAGASVLEWLSENIGLFAQLLKVLGIGATAWVGYKAAVLLSLAASKLMSAEIISQSVLLRAQRVAALAFSAAQALATGNITKATKAMRILNTVMKLNPVGLIVGGIVAAGTALAIYSERVTEVSRRQQTYNDIMLQAKKDMVSQEQQVRRLMAIAQDETKTLEDREKAVKRLREISPEYFKDLTVETAGYKDAKEKLEAYVGSMRKRAVVQVAQAKLDDLLKKRAEETVNGIKDNVTWYDKLGAVMKGNLALAYASSAERTAENVAAIDSEISALQELIKANQDVADSMLLKDGTTVEEDKNKGGSGLPNTDVTSTGDEERAKRVVQNMENVLEVARRLNLSLEQENQLTLLALVDDTEKSTTELLGIWKDYLEEVGDEQMNSSLTAIERNQKALEERKAQTDEFLKDRDQELSRGNRKALEQDLQFYRDGLQGYGQFLSLFAEKSSGAAKFLQQISLAEMIITQGVIAVNALKSIKGLTPIDFIAQMGIVLGAIGTIVGGVISTTKSTNVPEAPAFESGTPYLTEKGRILTGERGRELVRTPSGELFMAGVYGPQLARFPVGSRIFSNTDTERLLSSALRPAASINQEAFENASTLRGEKADIMELKELLQRIAENTTAAPEKKNRRKRENTTIRAEVNYREQERAQERLSRIRQRSRIQRRTRTDPGA